LEKPIRIVDYIRVHWVLLSSLAAGTVAVFTTAPQFIEAVQKLYRRFRRIPDAVSAAAAELTADVNVRFGFRFDHPSVWDRRDPENSDGATYTNPQYPKVEIRAWGSYAVVWSSLDAWINECLYSKNRDEKASKIHALVDSGRYLVKATPNGEVREKIDGKRVVYDVTIGSKKYTAMQQFVQVGNRQVGLRCLAPRYLFSSFNPLFLKVCASLEILVESQSAEAIRSRRTAILALLRSLKPNELVKTSGIHAALVSEHREFMEGIDEAGLEEELWKMADEKLVFRDSFVDGWTIHKGNDSEPARYQSRY
jgi:hypothetical protein